MLRGTCHAAQRAMRTFSCFTLAVLLSACAAGSTADDASDTTTDGPTFGRSGRSVATGGGSDDVNTARPSPPRTGGLPGEPTVTSVTFRSYSGFVYDRGGQQVLHQSLLDRGGARSWERECLVASEIAWSSCTPWSIVSLSNIRGVGKEV